MDEAAFKKRLSDIEAWLHKEYTGIRTGQAAPALLDSIRVEAYGSMMPLNQVGSIGVEDARTLRISPWDASTISAIERAITDANLGVSVATDSSGLRVIFPELTSERRTQLMKLAKSKLEEARVSVRTARDEAIKEIEAQEKKGELSEDEKFAKKDDVQELVNSTNAQLETIYTAKEKEIQI